MSKSLSRKLVDKPYIVWSVLFIIAPLVMVLYYAFTDTSGAFSLSSIYKFLSKLIITQS